MQSNAQTGQHNAQPPAHANDRAYWQDVVNLPERALPNVAWWQEPEKADELVKQIQVGQANPALTTVTNALSIWAAHAC